MATKLSTVLNSHLRELRFEPTAKRIRALLGPAVVLDSRRAVLVWEPRRVLLNYAVPVDDVVATLAPSPGEPPPPPAGFVLHAGIPFAVHMSPGTSLDVAAGDNQAADGAFRLDDPDLAGHILFDFDAFDWLEEDEPVIGHPRDPFHRVDVRQGSEHVRIHKDGLRLAESVSPKLVFETSLQTRIYLPPDDVDFDTLVRTDSTTICQYKGRASYWALASDPSVDVAWSYETPFTDAADLAGFIAFYDDLVDVEVDVDT
ncbi:DUF427 domain-containing protein [Specibacter cremeus]|uniref:DUF427 domain-containing protein n=1 Tax=Specibacter cremeus TaxID=1629051 RepID=UPI000F7B920A|nr:DUF427 domain-containing protein [Specibacter cremeus]